MILIRVDANEYIGIGHLMRCFSVARALDKRGERILFVTADHNGDALIEQQGYDVVCLNSDWKEMENEKIGRVVEEYKPSILLLDSYNVTKAYIDGLDKIVRIAYFDDLNKTCWNVDYLINYNIYANVFDYSEYIATKTKLLLNPQYAPLRDEFKNCSKHRVEVVSDILVSAGGADPACITEKLITAICPELNRMRFHFVVGMLNPRIKIIKSLAKGKENVVLHINESNISELMKNCTIAISAAGTTLYELCAVGIPTVTYTMADNQLLAAEQFNKQGIMINSGDCREEGFTNKLKKQLCMLIENRRLREELSDKMQNLVDGEGATRIAEALL